MDLKGTEETKAMFGNKGQQRDRKRISHARGSELNIEGSIETVYFDTKMPSVDVNLIGGGLLKFLSYSGGFLLDNDGDSAIHGLYITPKVNQRVMVSFANGDINTPYISEMIFRAGKGIDSKLYKNFADNFGINEGDVLLGHSSGKSILLSNDAIQIGNEIGDWQNLIGYDALSDFLKLVVGNLGTPLFPLGLPRTLVDIFDTGYTGP